MASVAKRNTRFKAYVATLVIIFAVILSWILYEKSVEFYKIEPSVVEISPNVEEHYIRATTIAYSDSDQWYPEEWKFVVNKTYNLQKLHSWTPVPLLKPDDPDLPGEMGREYHVPENKAKIASDTFNIQNYNLIASAAISLNRSLSDVHPPECNDLVYSPNLPDTSVIIIFHNEALPTLLRTVYSIIERSPRSLLKEIILVDDVSDVENYGNVLDKFIDFLPVKVRLIRTERRAGLIRARLLGAKHAKGSVLTFLDAHIECTHGWLEPLLHQIASDRSTVVCPMIDKLSIDTFEYVPFKVTPIGFHWFLQLDWDPFPYKNFSDERSNKTEPFSSPSMVGCAFAIDREFFYEIGSYDEGLEIWGSENLELSLRVWQCGGRLKIVPCSHVGHLYRISTYSFGGNQTEIVNKNNVRVAEVWLDEYKEFFYNYYPGARQLIASVGDLSERKALRQRLKCKSFEWYLKNVYPETTMNSVPIAMGEIRNEKTDLCLAVDYEDMHVCLQRCSGNGKSQAFVYTRDNKILSSSIECIVADSEAGFLYASFCDLHKSSLWKFNEKNKTIIEMKTGKCLGILMDDDEDKYYVHLDNCTDSENQRWTIKKV